MRSKTLLALVGLAALVVAACGGPSAQPSASAGASGSAGAAALSGNVRVSGWSSSPAEDKLVTDAIDAFMKANPGVKVTWEPIAKDYDTVLKTNIAAGTEADVFYVDINWVGSLMTTGKLMALDDLMSKSKVNRSDFVPSLIDAFSYQSKTYGLPKDFNTLGLVYNKDLFTSAGVKEPTNDWTWDDLKAAAKQLTKGGAVGVSFPADAARFVPFLWEAGGDLANINNDKGQMAFDFYTGFEAKDKTSKLPSELGMGWPGEALAKAKAAIAFEGGWLPAFLKSDYPNVKYGVVQMPKGPASKSNLIFTVAYAMSAKTKNPDASFAVLNYLTGAENQRKVLQAGFALPTRQALGSEITDPGSKEIFNGAAYGKPFNYGGANNGKINDAINKQLEAVMTGKSSVQDALNKLANDLKPLVQ
jgi:multiple sugar transport system substrate-binding protein